MNSRTRSQRRDPDAIAFAREQRGTANEFAQHGNWRELVAAETKSFVESIQFRRTRLTSVVLR